MRWVETLVALPLLVPAHAADRAVVRPATETKIPIQVDGNSPTFWRDGQLHFTTSTGTPVKARGADQFSLARDGEVRVEPDTHYPIWIEATWVDDDGVVYGWYHHEPRGLCPGSELTAPQIGAAVSYDGGSVYQDLGIVLTSPHPIDCNAKNGFFGSGNGDFSVILDHERSYFYFFFTHYGGNIEHQGIAIARLAFGDRGSPAGAVWKFHNGDWTQPGLGGDLTPVLRTKVAWQRADADSFWGPAVHWNSHLNTYVMLLNHACCEPGWPQAGIYYTTNPDLTHPESWITPELLLEAGPGIGFYPQVMGLGPGETDRVAGEVARLYVQGESRWEILFSKTPDNDPEPDPPPDPTEEIADPASVQKGARAAVRILRPSRLKPAPRR